MDVVAAVRKLGCIASRAQLVALGFSGGDLTTAVRLGQLWRIRRGYYVANGASSEGLAAVRVGGRLGGVSAAASYGLWHGFDPRVHVVLAANASRLRTQLAPSESDFLTPDSTFREVALHWIAERSKSPECWRVTANEALVEAVNWSDTETAIACLDTARTALGLTSAEIDELFRAEPAAARARARASCPGSDSGLESVVRQRLARMGVRVEQQVRFAGVGRVDMVVPGARLVVELDGAAFHSSPESVENDRRRGAVLATRDHRLIRLSFARVFGDWDWCEAQVRAALS